MCDVMGRPRLDGSRAAAGAMLLAVPSLIELSPVRGTQRFSSPRGRGPLPGAPIGVYSGSSPRSITVAAARACP
jgi:hypothetical protein